MTDTMIEGKDQIAMGAAANVSHVRYRIRQS
jgi:hypothetical protein